MTVPIKQGKYHTAETFLNENLEHHFKSKGYSIIGTKCCYDSMGGSYISYAFKTYDVPIMTTDNKMVGWFDLLKHITKNATSIINGLIFAKKVEKPEGADAEVREVVVDWRSYPTVDIKHDVIQISFRVSLHHK